MALTRSIDNRVYRVPHLDFQHDECWPSASVLHKRLPSEVGWGSAQPLYREIVRCREGSLSMPNCQNCGAFVTDAYARVFTPDDHDEPRVCPECPDKLREGAEIREARSQRRN